MLRNVFGRTMWESRRSIVWWVGGLVALTGIMVGFYPSMQDMGGFAEMIEAYPEGLLAIFGINDPAEFLTAAGFLSGELYSAMIPVILLIFTIQRGAAATAAAEQDGTMDLILSTPVSRKRVVVESFLAMVALTVVLGTALAIVLVVGNPIVDMGLSSTGIVAINLGVVLLALVFGALALAVGAMFGSRKLAAGVAAAATVAAFFVNGLAPLVPALEIPQKFSPFYWLLANKPLTAGFDWWGLCLLVSATAAFFTLAVWAFDRRDIST